MPYSIDYKNKCVHKKVTKIKNGKKVTMRGEKVGCTKGSLDDYIAALQIHAENKKTMKKTVKEQDELQKPIDGSLNQVFAVQKPYAGCELTSLVKPIDPLLGIGAGHSIVPDQIHAVFADEPTAQKIATELYETHMEGQQALEEKKEVATKKLKSVIDAIEKKRKEHMDMAKEDPKNASKHREQIAIITDKLDDLMNKLEKIEKSKKPIEKEEKKEDKKNLKESYEVHFSDGVRQSKTFKDPKSAISFAKSLIDKNKNLQHVDVFNAGPNFHSTTDTDSVIAWWGDGSYMNNKAKKDSKLASKKIK